MYSGVKTKITQKKQCSRLQDAWVV